MDMTPRLSVSIALPTCVVALAAVLAPACKDVTSFATKPGEAYCGNIVEGPFVRTGLGPGVQLSMTFDGDGSSATPGTLATSDKLLQKTSMRSLPQFFNDPLSTYDFGEGRQKSYLYFLDPTDGSGTISAFVSFMESGDAEVRLVRGGTPGDASNVAIFGVFPLSRQQGGCGF